MSDADLTNYDEMAERVMEDEWPFTPPSISRAVLERLREELREETAE